MIDFLRRKMFQLVFEEIVPFKWINGHKTQIARVATAVFATLYTFAQFFPEIQVPLEHVHALAGTVLGLFAIELGKIHREDKHRRRTEELVREVMKQSDSERNN